MTKNERLQRAWHRFDSDHEHLPTSTRQAFEWAVAEGFVDLPQIDLYDIGAEQMAQALRAEMGTDQQGRRYRVNHAVRATKGGVQYTFWGMLGFAPHDHMEKAFAQRREQIIGDCLQLRTDVDVYNDMGADQLPRIQLVLNFEDDVAERQQVEIMGQKKKLMKGASNKEEAA